VSFSAFTNDYEPFTEKKAGLLAGGFIEYSFYDFLGVSIDPIYLQKGAINVSPNFLYDDPDIYAPYNIALVSKVTSHHIQLPLIVRLRVSDNSCCVKPFFNLGASISYTLNVTAKNLMDYGSLNGQKYYDTMEEGVTSQFEEWEYHALLGTGIEFEQPYGNLFVQVDYNVGFSKINKYKFQYQYYDYSSNFCTLKVGFRLK
jgi:hypothetical protein